MPIIYSMCDVLVLPSESDTWGLVMNEAMANGLAIIATNNCGGAIDLIDKGKNGFIFKTGDSDELAYMIKHLASDKDLLVKMKEQSLMKINKFSYDTVVEKIETIVMATQ